MHACVLLHHFSTSVCTPDYLRLARLADKQCGICDDHSRHVLCDGVLIYAYACGELYPSYHDPADKLGEGEFGPPGEREESLEKIDVMDVVVKERV